jgi:hypothetical protein
MTEAQRQKTLLLALQAATPQAGLALLSGLPLRQSGPWLARGLQAYRANAQVIAYRALSAAFPTVHTLLGIEDFTRLAHEFWAGRPPQRGDLNEWGHEFSVWLSTHEGLAAWPYLTDCARLDWALHCCACASDAALNVASLSLLESSDPSRLRLQFMPGVALLHSDWPIGHMHQAHQLSGDEAELAFVEVRAALASGQDESVWVARKGWRPTVHVLDPDAARWMQQLADGATLAQALESMGPSFDFAAWLVQALRESWLQAVVVDQVNQAF